MSQRKNPHVNYTCNHENSESGTNRLRAYKINRKENHKKSSTSERFAQLSSTKNAKCFSIRNWFRKWHSRWQECPKRNVRHVFTPESHKIWHPLQETCAGGFARKIRFSFRSVLVWQKRLRDLLRRFIVIEQRRKRCIEHCARSPCFTTIDLRTGA